MEIMADLATRAGRTRGQTGRETLDQFILGNQNLFEPGF
jgi:hypothetical protein